MNTTNIKKDIVNEIVDIFKKNNVTYAESREIISTVIRTIEKTVINSESLKESL